MNPSVFHVINPLFECPAPAGFGNIILYVIPGDAAGPLCKEKYNNSIKLQKLTKAGDGIHIPSPDLFKDMRLAFFQILKAELQSYVPGAQHKFQQ